MNKATKVYVVLKNEIWDGENWDMLCGVFYNEEDAKAELKKRRDAVYSEWADETIEEDSDTCFCAYREGEYLYYHCDIYIRTHELK